MALSLYKKPIFVEGLGFRIKWQMYVKLHFVQDINILHKWTLRLFTEKTVEPGFC